MLLLHMYVVKILSTVIIISYIDMHMCYHTHMESSGLTHSTMYMYSSITIINQHCYNIRLYVVVTVSVCGCSYIRIRSKVSGGGGDKPSGYL